MLSGIGASVTINGGTIEAGWYPISGNNRSTWNSSIVVNGGELISTADYAIYHPIEGGMVTINGGTVYGEAGGIALNAGELLVKGGTVTSKGQGSTGNWGDGTGKLENAAVNISANYDQVTVAIIGGILSAEGDAIAIATGTKHPVNLSIRGGTFKGTLDKLEAYLDPGYILDESGEVMVDPNAASVAQIGGEKFPSIQAAVKAAKTGETITLLTNVSDVETIIIDNGKEIDFDLAGHNIEFTPGSRFEVQHGRLELLGKGEVCEREPTFAPVVVRGAKTDLGPNYSTVVIGKDVTVRGWAGIAVDYHRQTAAAAAVEASYGAAVEVNGTLISVPDSTESGSAIYVQGRVKATEGNVPKITVNSSAYLKATGTMSAGIYQAGYADTVINSAAIEAADADSVGIEIRAGKLTIEGNTVIKGGTGGYEVGSNGDGSTTKNAAVAVAQHGTSLPIEVTINGGSFEATCAFSQSTPQDHSKPEDIVVTIQSGEFVGEIDSEDKIDFIHGGSYSDPVNSDYLDNTLNAQMYSTNRSPDAPYSYYHTVQEALDSAQPGDNIVDLNNPPDENTPKFTLTLKPGNGEADVVYTGQAAKSMIRLSEPSRSGYRFGGWYDENGTAVGDFYTITDSDATLTARWSRQSSGGSNDDTYYYTIWVTCGRNGSITPEQNTRVAEGRSRTFTITPDKGYEVADVLVDGESVGAVERYTFQNVQKSHTIKVSFQPEGVVSTESSSTETETAGKTNPDTGR